MRLPNTNCCRMPLSTAPSLWSVTLRHRSLARFTHFRVAGRGFAAACMWAGLASAWAALAPAATESDIRLELSPRICTLAAGDKQCETRVSAQWRSPREEALGLLILNRPEVPRCSE